MTNVNNDLLEILEAAVSRVKLANTEGDTILSAWLPEAEEAIAAARAVPTKGTQDAQ